jgi:AcrR family transcriptional regulator
VHKTTLYRWWPSKDALLGAALVAAPLLDGPMPDTGSLRGDLEHVAAAVVRLLTSPRTAPVVTAALAAAADNPVLHEHARAFFADRLGREQAIVDRAIDRGELAADVDRTLIFDLIGGAAWLRLVLRQQTAGPDFPARIVDAVLHGLGLEH